MSCWHAALARSRTALPVTSHDEDDALHERTRNIATYVAHAHIVVHNAATYENGVTNVHTRERLACPRVYVCDSPVRDDVCVCTGAN